MQSESIHEVKSSKILGIVLKSEFALPVALAHQQFGCHWMDYENHHNNSYISSNTWNPPYVLYVPNSESAASGNSDLKV